MSSERVLTAYRLTFVALIIVSSVQTIMTAAEGGHGHHASVLAVAEIAGAATLAWPRTQLYGASLLLLVFTVAQVLSAAMGEWTTRFLQYAASTLLIVVLDTRYRFPPTRDPRGHLKSRAPSPESGGS
jgi:hypothetical protein